MWYFPCLPLPARACQTLPEHEKLTSLSESRQPTFVEDHSTERSWPAADFQGRLVEDRSTQKEYAWNRTKWISCYQSEMQPRSPRSTPIPPRDQGYRDPHPRRPILLAGIPRIPCTCECSRCYRV